MTDLLTEAKALSAYVIGRRRDFHAHPELGFQEIRTSNIVAQELTHLGLEVNTGIGKTGVVGLLDTGRPGPVVMLRFDMDALPINEQTGAEYTSLTPGVMHACGHDGHTAIGLTVARLMHSHQGELRGIVKFVFQPAEEGLGGAQAMITDGVLQTPRPDFTLGLHLWNERPLGWLGAAPGPVMAASETFKVIILGKGGHGAIPQLAIDPVVAAAHVVTALQSITSRNVSPLETTVISVTMIHAGDTFNVIPPSVELRGTIRTFEQSVRQKVLERFEKIVCGVAQSFECCAEIEVDSTTPAVVNHSDVAQVVQNVARGLLPHYQIDTHHQTMGSEDMAYFMQDIPGCYFFVGSADAGRGLDAPHHHPKFDFNEEALPVAVATISGAAVKLLSPSTVI